MLRDLMTRRAPPDGDDAAYPPARGEGAADPDLRPPDRAVARRGRHRADRRSQSSRSTTRRRRSTAVRQPGKFGKLLLELPGRATPLRAGIIGGGWIARVHVPAIDAAAGVELVAVCDLSIRPGRGDRRAARRGRRTPAGRRCSSASSSTCCGCARRRCTTARRSRPRSPRGIHVYLEKPIARTTEDAEAIVAAAAAGPGLCVVGYQWHASELLDDARAAPRGQQVGMLVGRNYGPVAGPAVVHGPAPGRRPDPGAGQPPHRSPACDRRRDRRGRGDRRRRRASPSPRRRRRSTTRSRCVLHFASGALGSVHSVWSRDGQPELYATDVLADEATLALELGPAAYRITGARAVRRLAAVLRRADEPLDRPVPRGRPQRRRPRRIFCPPHDAIRTLAVALACERALETGGRVAV